MSHTNLEKYFLASIVESSQDSIITIDFDLTITSWNKAAEVLYGYTEAEAVGTQLTTLTLPEDLTMILRKVENIRNSRRVEMFETERVGKDGEKILLEIVVSPVKNDQGEVIGVSTIARDLSALRAGEKALVDRNLLRRLIVAQEDERQRIARDIHDELGQQLTTLRFRLKAAKERCNDQDVCNDIDEIDLIAEDLDRSVDFLAWELRPAMLEGTGLVAAINNYVTQWSRHSGVAAEHLASRLKRDKLDEKVEANLYRIVQEALNNIHKHADAKNVELILDERDGQVVLIISDDGKGFKTESKKTQFKGVGLTGMKERASLIGGTVEIESAPKKGTTIYVRVPV